MLRILLLLLLPALSWSAEKPLILDVWPGKPPGDKVDLGEEKVSQPKEGEISPTIRITNVSKPTISVFRSAADKDTGAAVLIAPGGGYSILAWDKEGEEVAAWLNTLGVTGIVLKYRVPRRSDSPSALPPIQALMDAQRAMSLVRSKAKEWNLKPEKIGMLGFSAGGHLTAWTATNFDKRSYEAIDDVDKVSCRPDFCVLIYPAYLINGKNEISPEIRISAETPPCFFAHASDDPVRTDNSITMYQALRKLRVKAELHIYVDGGHGFGLRQTKSASSTWPARAAEWMKTMQIVK